MAAKKSSPSPSKGGRGGSGLGRGKGTTKKGGGVFSVGSIAWAASLPHNEYDNNVSRISENVVRRFLDPDPFVMPD